MKPFYLLVINTLATPQNVVLTWLSDIHLDSAYDPNTSQQTFCRRFQPAEFVPELLPATELAGTLLPAYHGRYGCDSPKSLFEAVLRSVRGRKRSDVLLITGDLAAHYGDRAKRLSEIAVAIECLSERPARESPLLVVAAAGNNDLPDDYLAEVDSSWNDEVMQMWSKLINFKPAGRASFRKGMFYRQDVVDGLSFISLNTVFYSVAAQYNSTSFNDSLPTDPAGQFAWLRACLLDVCSKNEQAVIVGHIPPTYSLFSSPAQGFTIGRQWHHQYLSMYVDVIKEFKECIIGQFYGHFHLDDYRLQVEPPQEASSKIGTAFGYILMAPAVSPIHGNNPSWRELTLRRVAGRWEVENYEQFYFPLYGESAQSPGTFSAAGTALKCEFEYDAVRDRFGGEHPINASTLRDAIDSTHHTRKDQRYVYAMGSRSPPPFLRRCVLAASDWNYTEIRNCLLWSLNTTGTPSKEASDILVAV